jgi:hypothetical protein
MKLTSSTLCENRSMSKFATHVYGLFCILSMLVVAQAAEPVKVLVITGGCCHDYDYQTKAMQLAAKEQGVEIDWTIVFEGGKGTRAMIDLYNKPD